MFSLMNAEFLKYRRTFSKKLIFFAPLFFVLYGIITINNIKSGNNYFKYTVFNWWPLIFAPLGTALICSLSAAREKKCGNYRGIRCRNVNLNNIWLSKIIVIALFTLISSAELLILLMILNIFIPDSISSVSEAVRASFAVWVTSLAFIPIGLFLAEWIGTAASMITSFIGIAAGVVMSVKPYWIFMPWSWDMRLMCPIIGVNPNGTPLESGSRLLDSSVIPSGIAVSIAAFIALSFLTAIWFSKREVS